MHLWAFLTAIFVAELLSPLTADIY